MKHLASTATALVLAGALTLVAPSGPAQASPASTTSTGRVSVLPGPTEPTDAGASINPIVSGSGRYVTFTSAAELSPLDFNGSDDVYVRDLLTDEVELISVRPAGTGVGSPSYAADISSNGRFVVFSSLSNELVSGDTNGFPDVFIRDRQTKVTERVSINSAGQQATTNTPPNWNTPARYVDVSDDGRYVAFASGSPVFGTTPGSTSNTLVRDRQAQTTEMISVSSAEVLPNRSSGELSMSADGRWVAFQSNAFNLDPKDKNQNTSDVYLRDRSAGTTALVSLTDGDEHTFESSAAPAVSDDGNKVAFVSRAALVPGDLITTDDVFVRTRSTATTTKVSTDLGGAEADQHATYPTMSGNGTTVAWTSLSGEYLTGGANGKVHVFQRVGTAPITRQSVSGAGASGDGDSASASLSTDGKVLAFDSAATNLVAGDTGQRDVFFRRNAEVGPHGTVPAFASAVAEHFTGAADPALAATVRSRLAAGASPQAQILVLAHRPAWAAKRAPLIRLYVAYFERLPDTGGLAYWLKKLNQGTKLDAVSARFAASSEFATKYGNTTNAQFVTLVYQNVLDRSPDAGGLAHWVGKLEGGLSRGAVMTNFSESSEGKRFFRPRVDTTLVALGMLGKVPAPSITGPMVADMEADSSALGIDRLLRSPSYAAAV